MTTQHAAETAPDVASDTGPDTDIDSDTDIGPDTDTDTDPGHPRRWGIMAVLGAVAFMAQLDFFVVNVALDGIG